MSKDWDKYDDWGSVLEDSDAAQRFRAPKKKPTPGEQLADQGGFLPDPELEDLSNPVDYFAMAMDPEMRRVYDQDFLDNIDFDEAVRTGNLQEGVKIRQREKGTRQEGKEKPYWETPDTNNPLDWLEFAEANSLFGWYRRAGDQVFEGISDVVPGIAGQVLGFAGAMAVPGGEGQDIKRGAEVLQQINKAKRQLSPNSILRSWINGKFIRNRNHNLEVEIAGIGKVDNVDDLNQLAASPHRMAEGNITGPSFVGGGFGNVQQNKIFQRTYSRSFAKGRGGFDYKDWINNSRRTLTNPKYKLETFQTADTQFVKGFFNNQKKVLKPIFLKEYGPWLTKMGIDPDTLELHHIFGVMQSAGLYDGVDHMDEGWRLVTGIMNKHGLFPGAPATSVDKFSNFKYVTKELHDLLHHQFLTKKLGVDGSKFFDERILYNGNRMKRIDIVNSGLEGRGFIAEEYAKIISEGRDLMDDGLLQMEALFSKSGITDTDKLVQVLSKATNKGSMFLGDTNLLLKSVNRELKSIAKEVNKNLSNLDEVPLNIRPKGNEGLQQIVDRLGLGQRDVDLEAFSKLSLAEQMSQLEKRSGMNMSEIQELLSTSNIDIQTILDSIE